MGHFRQRVRRKPLIAGPAVMYIDDHGTLSTITDIEKIVHPLTYEGMTDTVGLIGLDFNPCFHDKLVHTVRPLAQLVWEHNSATGDKKSYDWTSNQGIFLLDIVEAIRSIPPVYSVDALDDFSAKAEFHFKTAVDDTHSLLNFIIELIEMCEGNIGKLKEVLEKVGKALKTFWKLYEKTGNYWLAWNFAIKPTIGDVRAILNGIEAARKRLKWLRSRNHLDTKVKYRQQGWVGDGVHEYAGVYWPPSPTVGYSLPPDCLFEISYVSETRPASWAWVRFDIPDYLLEDFPGLGIVWSALSGLYNPIKVGWEAVPFSWLVDWFISKRTQLQLEAASLSPLKDAKILGTGWSLHTKTTGSVTFIGPPYEVGSATPQRIELGQFIYDCYDRRPGLPEVESSPFRVPFEWYNASIIGSLLQQKHRRG